MTDLEPLTNLDQTPAAVVQNFVFSYLSSILLMEEIIKIVIPYVQISRAIVERQDVISSEFSAKSEKKEAEAEIVNLEQKFNEDADQLVFELLKEFEKGDSNHNLSEFFNAIFDNLKSLFPKDEKEDNEVITRAINLTSEKLTALAKKQQSKSPLRRRVEKYGIFIFFAAIAIVALGVRFYSAVPTYEDIETREHLNASYLAIQKVERYDDWMDTRVRKGGWLKGIMFWPIEPREKEIQFASELLGLVVVVHDYAITEGLICNSVISLESQDIEKQLEYIHIAEDYSNSSPFDGNAAQLVLGAFEQKFPCNQ